MASSSTHRDEAFSSPRQVLITGGARAGKSRFAQAMAEQGPYHKRLFVATAVACDQEMEKRIARHRRSRNGRWTTLEEPTDLPGHLPKKFLSAESLVLLDCIPTFVTNLLLTGISPAGIQKRMREILKVCRRPGLTCLFISNEVGLGIVPDHPMGREFRDLLGLVNQQMAQAVDEVYFLVAGLPMRVK